LRKRSRLVAGLRIVVVIGAALFVSWWLVIRMPGRNVSAAAPLSPEEVTLREELRADVQKLAGEIGERNLRRYPQLLAAAAFIEESLGKSGLKVQRDVYEVSGMTCPNIVGEVAGSGPGIIVVGAHYDSVIGCPGANDNGSGVAAMLALARRFAARPVAQTLRFVAFVNEEPPYFQTPRMGSHVYAGRCRQRGDDIRVMISLETIGCFSDAPNSQSYPAPLLKAFYPTTGNFISLVSNIPSGGWLRRAVSTFRQQGKLPAEGAALPGFIPGVSWSDQWAFWQHGYCGFMVTDTAPFRYPHYHASTDTPDRLDYDRYTLAVSGMEKVVADFAGR
jgi:hypothetical protein